MKKVTVTRTQEYQISIPDGWRLLEDDETIKKGDLYRTLHSTSNSAWVSTSSGGRRVKDSTSYRYGVHIRRIRPELGSVTIGDQDALAGVVEVTPLTGGVIISTTFLPPYGSESVKILNREIVQLRDYLSKVIEYRGLDSDEPTVGD